MCGIAGIVTTGGFDPQVLISMTHLVTHRGPNAFGFAFYGSGDSAHPEVIHNENRMPHASNPAVGLGNRRLSILDLSEMGNMPMEIDDGAYCITYNGEVYNYKEIRYELEQNGYRFRTGTDTEVVLRAYQEWGEDCLQRFNGMWSFALWDRGRQTLFCARDRLGVKPFYYALHGGRFYCGSEIKQLVRGAAVPRTANSRTVFYFLENGMHDFSSETFFEGIRQLPGGHALRLSLSSPLDPVVWRYWELPIRPESKKSTEQLCGEFHDLFEDSIRLRLRSDVAVGASLSGGLDSSAVICEAKRLSPQQEFHTFSACFQEKEFDERKYVSIVVDAIRAKGHQVFPGNHTFWDEVDSLLFHQDEPVASGSVYAQWCVMADAKRHGIPVLLGGQGGDEILCGYQKYRYFYLWHLLKQGDPRVFREAMLGTYNGTRTNWTFTDASRYFPSPLRRRFSLVDRLGSEELRKFTDDDRFSLGSGGSIANRQKADLTFASLPSLLHYEDRNSMAHSVESRLPFLDYRLVQFAVNCPLSLKFRNGWSKWILREALSGVLPDSIRLRKSKLGFDTPQVQWMRSGLVNGLRDVWDTKKLRMERFVNPPKLASETKRFLSAQQGAIAPYPLFRAIMLELWANVYQVS